MAESERTPRRTDAPGPHPPASQEARSTREPPAHGQEPETGMRQPVHERTAQGKGAAVQVAAQGQEYLRMWQTQLAQQVREKPLQSLVLAAGIGLVVGLLKRR